MNSLLDSSYAWTGSFVEAFTNLVYEVADLVVTSLNFSTNATVVDSGSTETVLANIPQAIQEAASLIAFDDFQYLLLKIFVTILLGNFCFIYIAWYVYGERITQRFMSPNCSPEELKQSISQLKLPTEHSQRYS